MKKKSKKIISYMIGVVILGTAALGIGYVWTEANANGSFHLDYIKKDSSAPIGSKDNIFTVLEIVPNESMAQIGYMIPGCEPVDMNELSVSEDIATYRADMEREGGAIVKITEKSTRRFTDALTKGDKADRYVAHTSDINTGNELLLNKELKAAIDNGEMEEYVHNRFGIWLLRENYEYSEYGYYKNVGKNQGNFRLIQAEDNSYVFEPSETGSYKWVGTGYYYNDNTSGEYKRTEVPRQIKVNEYDKASRNYYSYTAEEGGNYHYENFHDAEEELEGRPENYGSVEKEGDKYWTVRTDKYNYEYRYNEIINHDLFIQQVFHGKSTEKGFQSQVLTVTPTQLNNMPQNEMQELMQAVDLIEFHTATEQGLEKIWERHNKKHKKLTETEKSIRSFKDNDINWEVTLTILERMASEDPAAVILEGPAMYPTGGVASNPDSNIKKLYIMLMQYGAKAFYNQFILSGQIETVIGSEKDAMTGAAITTGSYKNPYQGKSKTEWDDMTFWLNDVPDNGKSFMHETNIDVSRCETYGTVYSYNGDQSLVQGFLLNRTPNYTAQNGSSVADAFEYFEKKDGKGSHADGLNGLDFIEYILHGLDENQKEKTHLNILEIQPCNTFIYGSDTWKLYYMNLIPWFKGSGTDLEKDLSVTTMPTWEFIGNIEDLNGQYDFIVFGSNQDGANGMNEDGSYKYNDEKLKGLIYSGIGDLVTANPKDWESGVIHKGENGTVMGDDIIRYSGNDITERKYKELVSYLQGNQAVVIDGKLYNKDISAVDESKVDSSSVFYRLAELAINTAAEEKAGENIFITTSKRQSQMKDLVAYEKCDLEFYTEDGGTGYPVEYAYESDPEGGIIPGTIHYAEDRKFIYQFKINGLEKLNYGISLYIDRNGDGIYTGSLLEQIVGSDDLPESMVVNITDRTGQRIENGTLKADTWYVAECNVPVKYTGILPWKLEVYETQNTNIRDSVIKYSAVKADAVTRTEIKALQMTLTPDMSNASSYYSDKGVLYMATSGEHTNQQLKKYLECVEDYKVSVDYLENEKWKELFLNRTGTSEEKLQDWKDYLEEYDILLLGYCDNCSFSGNEIYKEGVSYFKEIGKGIMLSHDMVKDKMSADLLKGGATDYDSWIRNLAGQRRYKSDEVAFRGDTVPLIATRNYKYKNVADYRESIVTEAGNIQTVPAYGDNSISLFLRFGLREKADRVVNDKLEGGKTDGTDTNYWKEENYETTYINLVNQGQITNYPYKIDNLIEVNATHCQLCQLDMDEESMAVWSTMTDSYSKKYQDDISRINGETATDSYLGTGVYSSRESDVRNGFYLYTAGNITYTGVGHVKTAENDRLTADEMKLYVNTLISAYRATPAKPYVQITNEERVESGGDNLLYVPYDEKILVKNEDNSVPEYLAVTFKVKDESVQENFERSYALNFCDRNGKVLAQQPIVYGMDGTEIVKTTKGYTVERDGEYYFNVPYTTLGKEGKLSYYLNLTSAYLNRKKIEIKTSAITKATVLKMPLFNLN